MFWNTKKVSRVNLTCPYCGNGQDEPSRAISSFCRSCGEHFRIRRGIAVPNPGLKVSGIVEPHERRKNAVPIVESKVDDDRVETDDSESWVMNAEDKKVGARALTHPAPEKEDPTTGISAGAFFGLVDEENEEVDSAELTGDDTPDLSDGTMEALISSQKPTVVAQEGKMPPNFIPPEKRKKRSEPVSLTEVRCFRCYHSQRISRFAKSTQCERCSSYIALANYDIKAVKTHTLRTRGDITIRKRGGLIKNSEIACHNLVVNGAINALVDASGDVTIRNSGTIRGEVFCRKLIVEKNCSVNFPDGVKAANADIMGHVIGDVTSSEIIRVGRSGIIEGDAKAPDIQIRDGGRISGKTDIDPETTTELPLRKGFNPSIIG